MKPGSLDEYALKARVYPAFLAIASPAITIGQLASWTSVLASAGSALGGAALLSFVLAQWSRDAGKRRESDLFRSWDGGPTTKYLRHRDTTVNPVLKTRRCERLQRMAPDLTLPSARGESEKPGDADLRYEAATTVLIQRTRDKQKYNILFQELIEYGFRRNAWGLRKVALPLAGICLVVNTALTLIGPHRDARLCGMLACLILLVWWGIAVQPEWVHRAAKTYAERLFDCLDDMDDLDAGPSCIAVSHDVKGHDAVPGNGINLARP